VFYYSSEISGRSIAFDIFGSDFFTVYFGFNLLLQNEIVGLIKYNVIVLVCDIWNSRIFE